MASEKILITCSDLICLLQKLVQHDPIQKQNMTYWADIYLSDLHYKMVHAQCKDMLNHTSTSLTQTASSIMENIQTYYMVKLDPVTGRQTLIDTLTDAACTSQLKCYLKWISAFYMENMSLQLSIIEL